MGMIYRRKWKNKDGEIVEGKTLWIKYYDRNGKPLRESTKSTKDADAKRLLKRREGEISSGKVPGVYFDKVKFDELAHDYLTDYRINGKRVDDAERYVMHLSRAFEGMRVVDISTSRIQAYIEKRLAGEFPYVKRHQRGPEKGQPKRDRKGNYIPLPAENSTINRDLSALRRMLNLGAQQTPPKVDRVPHIPMLQEDNVKEGFFEHEEYEALRDAAPEHLKGPITFAYKYGWRKSEVCALTWAQVDLRQGIVRLEPGTTKNKKGRTVYLDDEAKAMFRRLRNSLKRLRSGLSWVFLNEHGTDRVRRFDKSWKSACKKAGISGKTFHDFRRTAVRNMTRAGIPERMAMLISGHRTRSVFDRYDIANDKELRMAAQMQALYHEKLSGTENSTGTVTGTVHDLTSVNPRAPVAQADRAPDS